MLQWDPKLSLYRAIYRLQPIFSSARFAKLLLGAGLSEIGVLATFASGLVWVRHGWVGLTCIQFWDYGFPYAWREILSCGGTTIGFNWFAYLLDTVFYAALAYLPSYVTARKQLLSAVKDQLVAILSIAYILLTMGTLALIAWNSAHVLA